MSLHYFRLSDEELLIEAEMEYPLVDPRIWNEATRRGIAGRLNAVLMATPLAKARGEGASPKASTAAPQQKEPTVPNKKENL